MAFISLHSFADESYGHDIATTPWYVVAGYVGTPRRWRWFEKAWRELVTNEGIQDVGFHANECVRGKGRYSTYPEDQRERIQRRLIQALGDNGVEGVLASVDMNLYRQYGNRLKNTLAPHLRKYNNPYLLSFHQFIVLVSDELDKTSRRIGFVFHRRPKGALGSVPEWYEAMKTNVEFSSRPRLGPFAWGDQQSVGALNAADMLAYCGYRQLSGNHTPWQWDELNHANRILPFSYDKAFWDLAGTRLEQYE